MASRVNWEEREAVFKGLLGYYRFLDGEGYIHLPIYDWVRKKLQTLRTLLRTRRYYQAHPEKSWAKGAVCRAVKRGDLIRPDTCEECGEMQKVMGHHESYARGDWLYVVWLCAKCHRNLHQEKRRAE